MTQPDWSKAPKGATHWGPANEHFCQRWYRKHRGEWWCHYASMDDWYLVSMDRTRHDQLIPRPAKPRWRYHWGRGCNLPDLPTAPTVLWRCGLTGKAPDYDFTKPHFGVDFDIIAYRLPD